MDNVNAPPCLEEFSNALHEKALLPVQPLFNQLCRPLNELMEIRVA